MYRFRVVVAEVPRRLRAVSAFLIAALVLASAVAASGGGLYKGKSKQGLPVSFRVSGTAVKSFSLTGNAICISASKSANESYVLRSAKTGKLSGRGAFTISYVKNTTHVKITGKVSGKSASGRVELHYTKLWQVSGQLQPVTCWINTNWTVKR
ncbi:MAG: hypothetical protein ABSC51_05665 [Gaiellaceae bacterium]